MDFPVDSFLSALGVVMLSEFGDKSQLLALTLAARFKARGPVLLGIFLATVVSHGLASTVGVAVASQIPPRVLAVALGLLFVGFGVWTLMPEDEEEGAEAGGRFGPFLSSAVVFFLAELGDKTQLATVAMAARFQSVLPVALGAIIGMFTLSAVAVFAGEKIARLVPMKFVKTVAAAVFVVFGILSFVTAFRQG